MQDSHRAIQPSYNGQIAVDEKVQIVEQMHNGLVCGVIDPMGL